MRQSSAFLAIYLFIFSLSAYANGLNFYSINTCNNWIAKQFTDQRGSWVGTVCAEYPYKIQVPEAQSYMMAMQYLNDSIKTLHKNNIDLKNKIEQLERRIIELESETINKNEPGKQ